MACSFLDSARNPADAAPGQTVTVPWFVEDSVADSLAVTLELMSLLPLTPEYPAIGWIQPLDPATERDRQLGTADTISADMSWMSPC